MTLMFKHVTLILLLYLGKEWSSKGSIGQCCVGHWHAFIDEEGKSSCPAGGHWHKPKKTNQKHSRVDNNNTEEGFPGLHLEGAAAVSTHACSVGWSMEVLGFAS